MALSLVHFWSIFGLAQPILEQSEVLCSVLVGKSLDQNGDSDVGELKLIKIMAVKYVVDEERKLTLLTKPVLTSENCHQHRLNPQ